MLAGPHGMKFTSRRSRMRCSALCTYTVDGKGTRISTQIARTSCPRAASRRARHAMRPFSSKAHLGRVDHALNDIQVQYVVTKFLNSLIKKDKPSKKAYK